MIKAPPIFNPRRKNRGVISFIHVGFRTEHVCMEISIDLLLAGVGGIKT